MPVRDFAEHDLPAVFAVYASAKLDEFEHEVLKPVLLPLEEDVERLGYFRQSEVFVYEDEEGVVQGFGARAGPQIRAMFVAPAARGKGVGRQLLERLLQGLDGQVGLNVAASNHNARALYSRYGFTPDREFATSYNGVPVNYMGMRRGPLR
jgi:GNAT superfamily N-acetyltransferase